MCPTLAYLGLDEAGWGRRVAEAAGGRGISCAVLSLDAPLRNEPVTIGPGQVVWQGTDLLAASAVLVEAPLFPWPQPHAPAVLRFEAPAPDSHLSPEREARSLALSALLIAAETRPVWNPPAAAHLAASPAVALDRLERAGLPVRPWSLEPAPHEPAAGFLVLDGAGPDRWHRPGRPPAGEPALVIEPAEGEVFDLLVLGGRAAGARGHRLADLDPAVAGLAERAAGALGLAIVGVRVAGAPGAPEVLVVEAGPDLPGWDLVLGGRVAPLLVERLVAAVQGASA